MNIKWINDETRLFLSRGYFEETVEERIKEIAEVAHSRIKHVEPNFKEKFIEYMCEGYYTLATPVWVNYGKNKGLPISCFGSYVVDSMDQILQTGHEIGMMNKYGGGTSAYLGEIRPAGSPISTGGTSDGVMGTVELYDTITNVTKQSQARRGACAVWLPIEHKDIMDFLNIRTPGSPVQKISFGVTISDEWWNSMIEGDREKREVWAKVLKQKLSTGYPYIFFNENANKNTWYEETDYKIIASNLCTEIMLPSTPDESFVCCVGSINLLHYDELIQTDAVRIYFLFLNTVMDEFIEKSKNAPGLERARRFAMNHRAIGMGVAGWHSYLQSKLIPFESFEAKILNNKIFKSIREQADTTSRELYNHGYKCIREGYANTTVMAIAPTKSTSFILNKVSPGIEPIKSNFFVKDLAKIKSTYKNPILQAELKKYNLDTQEVWESIAKKDGSVQHLEFPTREVFKTFVEISPKEIIIQAASRQKFIDQGQSTNLMIHPSTPIKELNQLYIFAHDMGIKSIYYQFNLSSAQELNRSLMECASCEG